MVKPPCPGVPPFPPHSSSQFRSLSDSSHHVSTHRYSSPRAEEAEEEGEGAREEEGGVEVADGWAGAKGVEKWKVKTERSLHYMLFAARGTTAAAGSLLSQRAHGCLATAPGKGGRCQVRPTLWQPL